MATINPYLNFDGTTEAAFTFYKSVFGGEFAVVQRFKDTPQAGQVSPADLDKIMHIAFPIKGNVLMATDAIASQGHTLKTGNNITLSLAAESEEEATKLFNGLSTGGTVLVPMAKMFWNAYFGMFIDKFGIQWMVNYEYPQK